MKSRLNVPCVEKGNVYSTKHITAESKEREIPPFYFRSITKKHHTIKPIPKTKTMPPKKRKSQFAAYSVAAAKSNTDEDSNEDNEEDVTILWEQLQAKQRKKMQRLETATEKLQTEKETMEASMGTPGTREDSAEANDVLTINAGGKLITAMRSTLIIPTDSMWAYMFS